MTEQTVGKNRSQVADKIEEAISKIDPDQLNGSNMPAKAAEPGAQQLISGAMIHTAEAHDRVLAQLDAIEAVCKATRQAIEHKRKEADRTNREFIDLSTDAAKRAGSLHEAVKAVASHLIEQESRR